MKSLMGEPIGLFMANEPGELNEENLYVLHCGGGRYNVAVGLSRLGAFPVYCTRLALTRLGKNSDGLGENGISTDLVIQAEGS